MNSKYPLLGILQSRLITQSQLTTKHPLHLVDIAMPMTLVFIFRRLYYKNIYLIV